MKCEQTNELVNCPERYEYIDICRAIGIILMVIGHSGAPVWLVKYIYGFHMPLFFILSGYLYDAKKWKEKGTKFFVKKKIRDYILPYFILSGVNLCLNFVIELRNLRGMELLYSTFKHIIWIIYSYGSGEYMPNCAPLWFLPCLFLSSIFFNFIMQIERKELRWMVSLCAVGVDVILAYFQVRQLPWHIEIALLGVVFMQVGYIIKERETWLENVRHVAMVFSVTIGSIAVILNSRIDLNRNALGNPVLFFIGAILLSYLCLGISRYYIKSNRVLSFVGKNTIMIMAFCSFCDTVTNFIWCHIPLLKDYPYFWWLRSGIVLWCCSIMAWVWNIIKKNHKLTFIKTI